MNEDMDFDQAWDQFFPEGAQAASEEEDKPTESQEAASETPEAEAPEDPQADDKEDGAEAKEAPGDIPYKRFAEIAKDRRAQKARVKELEAQLEAAKSTPAPQPQATEFDDELRDILDEDGGDSALQARIATLEAAQAEAQFEATLNATLTKHPSLDRKWLIDETIRTSGRISLEDLASAKSEDSEISEAATLASFFEKHPDLAAAYQAKQGQVDGKGKEQAKEALAAAPTLRGTATGKAPPSLDPKDGESNGDFLSRLWDQMGS